MLQEPIKIQDAICHGDKTFITHSFGRGSTILVIGASGFLGGSISKWFHDWGNIRVVPTEDNINIGFDPLSWFRWEELTDMALNPQFINYSNYRTTQLIIRMYSPTVIIYIPSMLYENRKTVIADEVRLFSRLYENFILLLEVIRDELPDTLFLLLSPKQYDGTNNIPWIRAFELSLSTYYNLYDVSMAIIRIKGAYGPWKQQNQLPESTKLCYIDDLVRILSEIITEQKLKCVIYNIVDCTIPNFVVTGYQDGLILTRKLSKKYLTYRTQQTKDVVMTTYFTTQRNPQYKLEFMNNNFYFMENFFQSIYNLELNMVIFHDALSDEFINIFKKNYRNCEFVKVADFHGYTPNDKRYFLYYDYIISHKDVRYALMTDLRDIKILNNPFEMMQQFGDIIYLGLDIPFHDTSNTSNVVKIYNRCYKYYPRDILNLHGNHNPGVLGGKRSVLLAALKQLTQYIEISSRENCNTAASSYLFHTLYIDSILTGWPLQMGFMTNQPNTPGLCVLHKWDEDSFS